MKQNKVKFKRASSIKIPEEFFKPLITGYPSVDRTFSEIGGIIPSQSLLISGSPGAGKTTLTLAIASKIAQSGDPVAFISLEMSDFQLAHQARKLKGFGNVWVDTEFEPIETMKQLRLMKPKLIVLDSIQVAAQHMNIPDVRAQKEIVKLFTDYAKETWTPVMLIGHCDKAGNYKGPSTLLHNVDSHLMVKYDKDLDMRTFEFGKNRFGGEIKEEVFGITRDSVWIGSPYIVEKYEGAEIIPKYESPEIDRKEAALGCITELKKQWTGSNVRATIESVFELLREEIPNIETDTIVKNRKKLKLDFRGRGVAHCHSSSGELVFGSKSFDKSLYTKHSIGYGKEKPFIKKWCKDETEYLIWCVLHEVQHLFIGMQHHKKTFFEAVEKLAEDFKYLFGK